MKCFVIMPFGYDNSNSIYENWIKTAVEEIEYKKSKVQCHRADKSVRPGEVITHIIENLLESEIVIADLTGRNPNVFYELGVRHTLANNTILISQDLNDIPFDLRTQRIITYKFDPDGMLKLKKNIREAIFSILESHENIDNPVRSYLYNKEIKKFFDGSNLPGYNLVETLLGEVDSLKKIFSEQFTQVRSIIESITADKSSTNSVNNEQIDPSQLSFFEGAWIDIDSDSFIYSHMDKGQLYIPYCWAGNDQLISHYYNIKIIGKYLVGRFKWFNSSISGFMFLETINYNELEGGWWFSHDVEEVYKNNYWESPDKVRNMNSMKWERRTGINFNNYPEWVKKYFKSKSLQHKIK